MQFFTVYHYITVLFTLFVISKASVQTVIYSVVLTDPENYSEQFGLLNSHLLLFAILFLYFDWDSISGK